MTDQQPVVPLKGTLALARGFLRVRRDPEPFLAGLAHRAIADIPFPLENRRILDLGCGTGFLAAELDRQGHEVISTDLRMSDLLEGRPPNAFRGDATELGMRSASIDGVICSNILEHTPTPDLVFGEIERVLRPGGWAWVSWTPWWSPFGGHAIAPLHFLGPERGLHVYTRLFGEPTGENLPFHGVWPTSVASMIDVVQARDGLDLIDTFPRYYPSQRWLMRLRHVREVAVWNCVLLIRRTDPQSGSPAASAYGSNERER
jgi:SAM-dependent methyltransferase